MEATNIVTAAVERPTQPPLSKSPIKTVWQTDIRSPSPVSTDGGGDIVGGSDDENGTETGWKKDRLWFEVSLLGCSWAGLIYFVY